MALSTEEIVAFREHVRKSSDLELERMLTTCFEPEWKWNSVADEINRRRKARRRRLK